MTQRILRRHERVLVPDAVDTHVTGNEGTAPLEGVATVIGIGGMFVRTKAARPCGTVLSLVLTARAISIAAEGTVRNVAENGIGVEFTALTPENEQELKKFLLQLRA
jgi:hypothetical protein